MPGYITSPQVSQVKAIYPGNRVDLVANAAVDSGITKTLQFALGPNPGNETNAMVFVNGTNQSATVYTASQDADSNYQTTGYSVSAGTSLPLNLSGCWVRCQYSTAPTTGSLTVVR